jgi:rare lipoprotein A
VGILPAFAQDAAAAAPALEGIASYYGDGFHGRKTSSGEVFDKNDYTAAHRTLPFGTLVAVTNLDNGKRVIVRVNDRGPFAKDRVIDLSENAARAVGMIASGTARVRLSIVQGMSPGPIGGAPLLAGDSGMTGAVKPGAARADPSLGQFPSGFSAAGASTLTWIDIRVASFRNKENADRLTLELTRSGFSPSLESADGYYRVFIRNLPESALNETKTRLTNMGFPGIIVTRYSRSAN